MLLEKAKEHGRLVLRCLLAVLLLAALPGAARAQTEISTWQQLHEMRNDLGGDYVLLNDLCPEDEGYTTYSGPGQGWLPVGVWPQFTGSFDGQGHTITGLRMARGDKAGLFGWTSGATIQNIGLVDVNVSGQIGVGPLVGDAGGGTVITKAWATGSVSGNGNVGGLVGSISGAQVTHSYSTCSVTAAGNHAGGLVGYVWTGSTISNTYATGAVSGADYVAALLGYARGSTLEESYGTGVVTGTAVNTRGLVGFALHPTSFSHGYWDKQTTGRTVSSGGGTGLDTVQMQGSAATTNMSGLGFAADWYAVEEDVAIGGVTPSADGYPILRALDVETQLLHAGQEPAVPPPGRYWGDFNEDGCVNFGDFVFLLENWGTTVLGGAPIGFGDFLALLENWGVGC